MFESMDFASLLPSRSTTEERQAADVAEAAAQDEDMCSMLPSLTWTERLIGCGACMVTGYLLSFGAFFRVKELIIGNPGKAVFPPRLYERGTYPVVFLPCILRTKRRYLLVFFLPSRPCLCFASLLTTIFFLYYSCFRFSSLCDECYRW